MKIVPNHVPFPHIIIDDFLSNHIVENIFVELVNLPYFGPGNTGSAQDDEGNYLKNNKGVFLDTIYKNRRSESIIFSEFHKKLFDPVILAATQSFDLLFEYYPITTYDCTLVSYYENSDFYKEHRDDSLFTALYYIHKTPKQYNGGEIVFNYREVEYEPEIVNNRLIIFPGVVKHRVNPVSMPDHLKNQALGRFCISTFIWKNSPRTEM